MGKKRAREADGLQDPPVNSEVDKMDEDGSSDDDVGALNPWQQHC